MVLLFANFLSLITKFEGANSMARPQETAALRTMAFEPSETVAPALPRVGCCLQRWGFLSKSALQMGVSWLAADGGGWEAHP